MGPLATTRTTRYGKKMRVVVMFEWMDTKETHCSLIRRMGAFVMA
jgi:hypothetical protein